jgi:hypothetical protein
VVERAGSGYGTKLSGYTAPDHPRERATNVGPKNSTGRVAECTRPNPKMRRGLSGLLVCRMVDEHTWTQGFRVVQAVGA